MRAKIRYAAAVRQITFFLLFVSVLLTGCIPGCTKLQEEEEHVAQPTLSNASLPSEEPLLPPPPPPPPLPLPAVSSSAGSVRETPRFVIDALGWAQDYRATFSALGKLRAIADARYTLKKGEEPPDIHAMYERLHAHLPDVALPEEDADLRMLMQELDRELEAIVRKLSKPPTSSELEEASRAREALRSKIDALYERLEQER